MLVLGFVLLAITAQAQTYGNYVGKGYSWSDSLRYGAATSDSTVIYDVGLNYDWFALTLEGNANDTVDSLRVRTGVIRENELGSKVDTLWGSYTSLKDSSWTDVNLAINNTVGVKYIIYDPAIQLLEITLINALSTDADRVCDYVLQAIRRD